MKNGLAILLLLFLSTCSPAPEPGDPLNWAEGAVWYQIFPERFRNGNTENDPILDDIRGTWPDDYTSPWQIHPWTASWYELQPYEKKNDLGLWDNMFRRRYGGDLVGVIEKLPYLKDLGVDVIYFNPIFEAPSLHKYDASTYHHVDNNFGLDREGDLKTMQMETADPTTWTFTNADKVFLDLIQKAHQMGIKVVIDGVFNHCGKTFWAFEDLIKKQEESQYKDWFDVTAWDDPTTPDTSEFDYKAWGGFKTLPEFRENDRGLVPPVKQHIFDITRRWMDPNGDGDPEDGIDGWRLDAANEVRPETWQDWHVFVKSINSQAIIVAELWDEASESIRNKQFDSTTNYPFAYAVVDFFIDQETRISVSRFDSTLSELRNAYPENTNHILMNLLGGHDTDRIASMIKNPDRNYNREASLRQTATYDPTKPTRQDRAIHKLIALFQMTYLGAPMIYYGDEAGLWGGTDPNDRKPMLWADMTYEDESYDAVTIENKHPDPVTFDRTLFEYYKKLIAIRNANVALRKGSFETILVDDGRSIFGFKRSHEGNEVLVVLNSSSVKRQVDVPFTRAEEQRDFMTGERYLPEDGSVTVSVAPHSGVILGR